MLVQTNMEKLPVEMNPFGNGFRAVETELQREQQAKRCTDPHAGRTWKIKHPQRIHPVTGAMPVSVQADAFLMAASRG